MKNGLRILCTSLLLLFVPALFAQQGMLKVVVKDGEISVHDVSERVADGPYVKRLPGRIMAESRASQIAALFEDGIAAGDGEVEYEDDLYFMSTSNNGGKPNLRIVRDLTTWEFDRDECKLTLKTVVTNNGDATAPESELGYYLSKDRRIRLSDTRLGGEDVPELAPGDTVTYDRMFDFDEEGAFFIGWILDEEFKIKEKTERDNKLNSKKSINCGDRPNLTLDLDHTEWEFDAETCSLHIHSRVINDGDGPAGDSRLGYYLSEDTRIRKTKDHRIGQDFVGHLDPGEHSNERFWVDLDDVRGVPPFDKDGVFYIGWIVDYQNSVNEDDETDNRFHSDTTITCEDGGDIVPGPIAAETFDAGDLVPETFGLAQNFPNPFNPATNISFTLAESRHVTLTVYDLLGREVRTLIDDVRPAGAHTVRWDGRDDAGRPLASGVYFYKLNAGDFTAIRKMVFTK